VSASRTSAWQPEIPPQTAQASAQAQRRRRSRVVARDQIDRPGVELAPELVPVGARGAGAARTWRASRPAEVVLVEHGVVRAGLARDRDGVCPRRRDEPDAPPRRDVDDLQGAPGLPRKRDRPADRLELGEDGPAGRVVAPAAARRPARVPVGERRALGVHRHRQAESGGLGHAVVERRSTAAAKSSIPLAAIRALTPTTPSSASRGTPPRDEAAPEGRSPCARSRSRPRASAGRRLRRRSGGREFSGMSITSCRPRPRPRCPWPRRPSRRAPGR
jgi:hypothetical protein